MGLDMYLYKKTYVKQWDFTPKDKQYNVTVTQGGEPVDHIQSNRIAYITEEVGYWRKFNALHKWFVDNCQGGVDDCREAYVSKENIQEILNILKQIDEDNSLAEKLLPVTQGFFFGSVAYDEYYFSDVKESIEIFENLLLENTNQEYYYRSSW